MREFVRSREHLSDEEQRVRPRALHDHGAVEAAIALIQDAIARVPFGSCLDAAQFRRDFERALWHAGGRVRPEFEVGVSATRGGRIDLLITEPFGVALELDRRTARRKSIRKLRTLDGIRLIVLRDPPRRPVKCPDGIDAVLGSRLHPWVSRLRRSKASQCTKI